MKLDKYMGMDVQQATTVVVVLDANGKVAWETIVATEAAPIIRLMQSLNGPLHVTFEGHHALRGNGSHRRDSKRHA
jgi:hypothetical protein